MAGTVPSREALRALARLCRSEGLPARRLSSSTKVARSHNSCMSVKHATCRRAFSTSQARCKTAVLDGLEPQTFANDPSRYDAQNSAGPEPGAQRTVDPSYTASSPALPDVTNYYTLFPQTIPGGLPRAQPSVPASSTSRRPIPSFHIDPRVLRKEFIQLQSQHHPDKFPAGTVAHRRAYALSTLLNNAYKTLSDPLLRSQYLLQILYDIDVMSEDNSAHPADQATLMTVMDAQEQLEDANDAGGEKVVEQLKTENRSRIRETEQELAEAFEDGDWLRAKNESVRLKYWRSLESGLQDWEPGKDVRLIH